MAQRVILGLQLRTAYLMADLPSIDDIVKRAPRVSSSEKEQALTDNMAKIALEERELATEREAARRGIGYIKLKGFPFPQEALATLSKEEMEAAGAAVLYRGWHRIRVGTLNPDSPVLHQLFSKFRRDDPQVLIEAALISRESFRIALEAWTRLPHMRATQRGVEITEEELKKFEGRVETLSSLQELSRRIPTTEILTMLLASAIRARASDLHFDLEEKNVEVRFRIDGVLHEVASLDLEAWGKVLSRIKLIAHLKLNISDAPQDGSFIIRMSGSRIDVRVSTLPTARGESVTMRLLGAEQGRLIFEKLGLVGEPYEALGVEIKKTSGMILATGPTGAGKTTTLHAILLKLHTSEVNIITIEDPIEYQLPGIVQTQVAPKRSYSFAQGLRAILRQDPDIIMVGEMRDEETTEVAVQAALTGHLVLSSVHTNSASGAVPRLLSLGSKPFLLAPSLNAALGQRLVRKLCTRCTVAYKPEHELVERAAKYLATLPRSARIPRDIASATFQRGKGCSVCAGLGYLGRIGIFEVLQKTPDVEKLILSGSLSEYQLQEQAIRDGMITMMQDGIIKALDGVTTLEEVFRVAA